MSVERIACVLHHAPVGGTDKVVLVGIANHDGDGGAWPSLATLAKYACIDERNVRKALRRLEDAGLIRTVLQGGGTTDTPDRMRPNRYEVLVSCPADCGGGPAHKERGVADVPPGGAVASPLPLSLASPPGGSLASPEPSLEPSVERKGRAKPVDQWEPSDLVRQWAKAAGWSPRALELQVESLRDWARSKGERKVDWDAALRNWLRRQTPPRAAGGAPSAWS